MYTYFTSYKENIGAPSFSKFARQIGITLAELISYRRKKEFDAAYRECCEIRRDYLIDGALSRRFDSSFTKFLYDKESISEAGEGDGEIHLTLEVIGDS